MVPFYGPSQPLLALEWDHPWKRLLFVQALWAFRGMNRGVQYVRKAHPEEGQGQRPGGGEFPPPFLKGSPLHEPEDWERSLCYLLPAGAGGV